MTAENDEYIASITGGEGVIDKQTGELRSTFDILQDLSEAWETLTSVEKQELAETVAGKTQRSLFTAIMTNFETAVGATEAALDSEGSAAAENEKRMDSLQGKIQQLKSAWQELARDTINSEFVKSLLNAGTSVLKFANTDLGRLITVIIALNVASSNLKKNYEKFSALKGIVNIFKGFKEEMALQAALAPTTAASLNTLKVGFAALKIEVQSLTKALLKSPLFWVAAAGVAMYGISKAINTLSPQMKTLEENTENSTKAYEDAQQKVEGYKTQLENVDKKISDLKSKGVLKFTDEEELKKLEAQKEELQDSLAIAEKIAKAKKEAAAVDIAKEMDTHSSNPFDFFSQDDAEKSIAEAKRMLKDLDNSVAESMGNERENIKLETDSMVRAYKAMAEEIKKKRKEMASDPNVTEKDQEELEKMIKIQGDLATHLEENRGKFKEWNEQLKDVEGYEDQAKAANAYVEQIDDAIEKVDEYNTKQSDTIVNIKSKEEELKEKVDSANEAFKEANTNVDNYQKAFSTLTSAVDEYNNSGYMSIDTLQSLMGMDEQYLSMLSMENGQLVLNTQEMDNYTNALIAKKAEDLQAAATQDLYNLSIGNIQGLSSVARQAVENLGTDVNNTKTDMANAIPTMQQFNSELAKSAELYGKDAGAGYAEQANAIVEKYKNIYSTISGLGKTTSKAGGTSGSGHRYTGSSKKSSGGGSKGKKDSSKSAKEEYKAEVDALYWYKNALDNAEESVDKLNDALKNTDNFNEQEKYIRQLIDATNNQINKTNDLKNAQVGQINDFINQLRQQGFAIDYNAQSNELYINNMQHLSDLTGDAAKNAEKLLDKIQDLNDDNRDLDGSIRDLTADVKDYYEQLEDIPEKKLEKFNDLMEEFQQSYLDQVQYQIEDLEHAMENDPRLKALNEQIEALEKQNDEVDKQKEMEEKLLAVEEAKLKLENARNQKTMQVYREGQGFVWEADFDAIKDAEEELKDAQDDLNQQIRDDQLEQLEAEKEAIENSYQDRIDALQNFLDEQEYLIDKANREGVQSFEELRNELKKYGLDSAEYLGKATDWLNNYNNALGSLNTTVQDILASSGNATSELVYSSAMQDRINQALSGMVPNVQQNPNAFGRSVSYDRITNDNQSVYINSIELPNVHNTDEFIKELKNLPRMAASNAALRK